MNCSDATILRSIKTLQLIQKTNPPSSKRWKEASLQLHTLFNEMARRANVK